MKYLYLICRILLGLMFVVFGANILHPFMKQPPMSGLPLQFMMVMGPTGWLKVIGLFQLLGGLLVLVGAVPLGLCILCPIIVNILCFHIFLTGGVGIFPGAGCAALAFALLIGYRNAFAGIFNFQAKPAV
jgi:hypothetical protein